MRVAIHQPQYWPWLPYLLKIEDCDLFIFLDSVDFQKNGLQNRNQIKTAQGAQWLTVPVKQRLGQSLRDTLIDNSSDWRRKHWQTVRQCYNKAAHFASYAAELEALYAREWSGLAELNITVTKMLMRWMGLSTAVLQSSALNVGGSASELILGLCLEVGAKHYLSGTGGLNYLNPEAFEAAGVQIEYQEAVLPPAYPQLFSQAGYINHLSSLDLLLNCGSTWRDHVPSKECAT